YRLGWTARKSAAHCSGARSRGAARRPTPSSSARRRSSGGCDRRVDRAGKNAGKGAGWRCGTSGGLRRSVRRTAVSTEDGGAVPAAGEPPPRRRVGRRRPAPARTPAGPGGGTRTRQGAVTGADVDDQVPRRDSGGANELVGEPATAEEVLSERRPRALRGAG